MTAPYSLTSEETAKLLNMSVATVERKARKGEIPAFKPGQKWVFPTRALLDWMDKEAKKRMAQTKNGRNKVAVI